MKIAIAQVNPTVGALTSNFNLILNQAERAKADGADLVVFPECVLTGYPCEDLVNSVEFMRDVENIRTSLISEIVGAFRQFPAILFGSPRLTEQMTVRNSAFLVDPYTGVVSVRDKIELPNYGVFDEKRNFESGETTSCMVLNGRRLGVMICEDMWFPRVAESLTDADALIVINGSPFVKDKMSKRLSLMRDRLTQMEKPISGFYVNLVGGQDELVFDGRSFVMHRDDFQDGRSYYQLDKVLATCKEDSARMSLNSRSLPEIRWPVDDESTCLDVVMLGTADYIRKAGFSKAIIGISGGIDSAVVAAIAVKALGKENVIGISMPSHITSKDSGRLAWELCENLGIVLHVIPIHTVVGDLTMALDVVAKAADDGSTIGGLAAENLQARARGTILMGVSNYLGDRNERAIVLSTGNKSEVSVGFCTLYGDMNGGFNPLKDVYKTDVYRFADLINAGHFGEKDVIPDEIIRRPPTAELSEGQKDSDSLPDYPTLDMILREVIDEGKDPQRVYDTPRARTGQSPNPTREVILRVIQMVDRAEFKRRQSCPGVKITERLYGRDRRVPIVNHYPHCIV